MSYCKLVEKIYSGLPTAKEKKLFTDFAHCKEKTVHQKTLKGHHGCVNALGIGANETLLSSAGDDTRVFIWNIQDVLLEDTPKPKAIMETKHLSNVFSTNFTPSGSRLISTGNDSQIIVHDVETCKKITRYSTSNGSFIAVSTYQSSVMPDDENIFIVCSDSPEVNVYDIRCPGREINSWEVRSELYSVDFHPNGRVFAIAGKSRIGVIDFRTGKDIYDNNLRHWLAPKGATHAKWTPTGAGLAVIRPCNVPIYIDFHDNSLTYLSDLSNAYHTRNTVKNCEFIDEHTVVTGSENFDIFMWHIDDAKDCTIDDLPDTAHVFDDSNENYIMRKTEPYTVLKGHRSIANIMKYSPKNGILFSSGVEKIVKVWAAYPFPSSTTEPELRRMGQFPGLVEEIPSDSSEDEVVLYHFDRMILELRPLSPVDSEIGFNMEFDTSPSGSEEDSDGEEVIFIRSSESSRSSSPDAVPIRRMVNNEPVEVDSDADDEAEDGDEISDCMDGTG